MPLKLSGTSLNDVRQAIPGGADPQCADVIDLLRRPYGELVDFSDPYSLSGLTRLCEAEGIPRPQPEER
jgi:hypothetical protein